MHLSDEFLTHADEWVLEDLYEAFHAQSKNARREGRFGFEVSCRRIATQICGELSRRYLIQREAGNDVGQMELT